MDHHRYPEPGAFDHKPLDLVEQLGALQRLEASGSSYPRDLADAVRDHCKRCVLVQALVLDQIWETDRSQLRQLLVDVHAIDQVVDPVLNRRSGVRYGV